MKPHNNYNCTSQFRYGLPCVPESENYKRIQQIDFITRIIKRRDTLTFSNVGVLNAFSHIEHLCFFTGLCLNSMCFFLASRVDDTKPHMSQRCSWSAWMCMFRTWRCTVQRLEYHLPQYWHCSGTLGVWTFCLWFCSVFRVGIITPQASQINALVGLWYLRWLVRNTSHGNL